MAQYNTPATLTGLFKEVYGSNIMNLIPESGMLTKMLPFVKKEAQEGNIYHQPVIVSSEHGFTYAAAQAGAFALNDHIAANMQDARIEAPQMLLRSAIGYDAASKASKGKASFMDATELLVENMLESHTKRMEISMIYGRSGLATTASSANVNSTTTDVTFTSGTFATGIWSGLEDAQIDFATSGGTPIGSGTFTITTINLNTRVVRVTGASGDITALDAATAAGALAYFRGSRTVDMFGLDQIMLNSGTLFNINAGTYGLWRSNTYSCGSAQLSMSKVLAGVSAAVNRGLNEDVVLLINPDTWTNLMSDLAALRRFDGSYEVSKGDNGFKSIKFYHQSGVIDIRGYNIIKPSEGFLFPVKKVRRLGATDITFETPSFGGQIFLQLPSNAGFELRSYSNSAIFVETPARCVKFTNIVNV